MTRPTLRIIHNLARSGSTLICKCLGCMDRVVLLSELHPASIQQANPIQQAHEWFGLLTAEDQRQIDATQGRMNYADAIGMIARRCHESGNHLVLRDWSHLDFTGLPFVDPPGYRLSLHEALRDRFAITRVVTVRHPIDQWLSLSRLALFQQVIQTGKLSVATFMDGYLRFVRACEGLPIIRYEDFTRAPEATMKTMCDHLNLPYDPSFIRRWHQYTTISGDVVSTRGGNRITPLARREYPARLMERFNATEAYGQALALLGYADS